MSFAYLFVCLFIYLFIYLFIIVIVIVITSRRFILQVRHDICTVRQE